jgi:hypothetical protein
MSEVNKYLYTVQVVTDTQRHADRVMAERIMHDENYGFDYTIDLTWDGEGTNG